MHIPTREDLAEGDSRAGPPSPCVAICQQSSKEFSDAFTNNARDMDRASEPALSPSSSNPQQPTQIATASTTRFDKYTGVPPETACTGIKLSSSASDPRDAVSARVSEDRSLVAEVRGDITSRAPCLMWRRRKSRACSNRSQCPCGDVRFSILMPR